MEYTTRQCIRFWLPDKRLVRARLDVETGCMTFEYLYRHIHPGLVSAIGALSDGLADACVFDLEPGAFGRSPPEWEVQLTPVPVYSVWPLALHVITEMVGGSLAMDIRCRRDWLSPELAREMNAEVLPDVCAAITLAG